MSRTAATRRHAARIVSSEATTVEGQAHSHFVGRNIIAPQKIKSIFDLRQIGVRIEVGSGPLVRDVPDAVNIIGHAATSISHLLMNHLRHFNLHVEKIDMLNQFLHIEVLEVPCFHAVSLRTGPE